MRAYWRLLRTPDATRIVVSLVLGAPRGRLVDREEPNRARLLLGPAVLVTDVLLILVGRAQPAPALLIAIVALSSAVSASPWTAVRSVWVTLLTDDAQRRTGPALMSVIAEVNFFTGPLLAGILIALGSPTLAVATSAGLTAVGRPTTGSARCTGRLRARGRGRRSAHRVQRDPGGVRWGGPGHGDRVADHPRARPGSDRRRRRLESRSRRAPRYGGPMIATGCLVTGTDTGVGKTIVTAAIVATLRARGIDAIGLKPVVTGTDDAPPPPWPADHELLAAVSSAEVAEVNVAAYGPPVSPHLAAQTSGRPIDPAALVAGLQAAAARHDTVIVEGVGGLLVPLADGYDVRELAVELGLALVVVARPGLGTINHTLLTLQAARARGLSVAGVVLNPWPPEPDAMLRSNRETIASLGACPVATFPTLAGPDPAALARAGAELPLHAWLGVSTEA